MTLYCWGAYTPLSIGEEMPEQTHSEDAATRYASCEDFRRIFEEDLNGLYQLSFLLTGDSQKAERCFVAGLEDCVKESRVFREWARTWAKRVIVKNAIRELHPQSSHANSSVRVPIILSPNRPESGLAGHFDKDAVSGLADFERFVFVLCVLEGYREHECALLLGCSDLEVREARTQAIKQFANLRSGRSNRYDSHERGGQAEALKA
jgi:DNA-directed RNA polymerase specialized sigma24 family protein